MITIECPVCLVVSDVKPTGPVGKCPECGTVSYINDVHIVPKD